MNDIRIDNGNFFDWGRTSSDYAEFRDIYPEEFYQKILDRGLCQNGQKILDLGTGTGVLPRNLHTFGGDWTGTDISENQIQQAEVLSMDMNIRYLVSAAEDICFPDNSFDVVTACQCFWYFQHEIMSSRLHRILKPEGRFLILCMEWLPFEDKIAEASENLVLKYNPLWSGAGEILHPISVPECYQEQFRLVYHEEYRLHVPFTRERWNGRMKACRGIGASLPPDKIAEWEKEHMALLHEIAPEKFTILHYAALAELQNQKGLLLNCL